jgi:WD40 repeat protein
MSSFDPEPNQALVGHSLNVCALEYGNVAKRLISGSWDNTARVWRESSQGWETEHVLDAHQQAIWGVAVVEQGPHAGSYLTGELCGAGTGSCFRIRLVACLCSD